jgi:hypothetical protein
VEALFRELEDDVDTVIALDVLGLLEKEGRLATIPKRNHRGFLNRIITDPAKIPIPDIPKSLPVDRAQWPPHIRAFKDALTSIVPNLRSRDGKFPYYNDDGKLCTINVGARGENLVESGYVASLAVGLDRNNESVWLVEYECWASMRQVAYLGGIRLHLGAGILDWACSCHNGCVFESVWVSFTYNQIRKRFCSHLCAVVLLLVRWNDNPSEFVVVSDAS